MGWGGGLLLQSQLNEYGNILQETMGLPCTGKMKGGLRRQAEDIDWTDRHGPMEHHQHRQLIYNNSATWEKLEAQCYK
jgi:hypothetical protein